jgi:TonB family protein
MPRTIHNCNSKLLFRLTNRFAVLLVLTVCIIASRPAQSADNVGQNNYGGRKVLSRVEPEYPADLKAAGIGGFVHLTLTVAPSGAVVSSHVVGGNPILAQAATRAVSNWKFSATDSYTSADVWFHFAP